MPGRLDRGARQVVAARGRSAQQQVILVDERDRPAARLGGGREVEQRTATESVAAVVDQRVHRIAGALAIVVEQAVGRRIERLVQRERGLQLALRGERGDGDRRGAAGGERRSALEPATGDAQARGTGLAAQRGVHREHVLCHGERAIGVALARGLG